MITILPEQLADFRCAAGDCPNTCCAGWTISIDPETDAFYQTVGGALGEYLNANIDRTGSEARFRLGPDNRCPMLREDGLCRIQRELGAERLSYTCTVYPRVLHHYGDYCLILTGMSCPEAGRELLSREDPLLIVCDSDGQDKADEDKTEDDILLDLAFAAFCTGIDILQDRSLSISQRQKLFLLMHRALQDAMDAGNYALAGDVLDAFSDPAGYPQLPAHTRPDPSAAIRLLREFSAKLILSNSLPRYRERIAVCLDHLNSRTDTQWAEDFSRRLETYGGGTEAETEHILVYLALFHYFQSKNWSPWNSAGTIVMLNQLNRITNALLSERQGAPLSFDERVLNLSFLARHFEHANEKLSASLKEQFRVEDLDRLDFLFRLVS